MTNMDQAIATDDAAEAYSEGFRNGRADRSLGIRSEYAWHGANDPSGYSREYGLGYRAGWQG